MESIVVYDNYDQPWRVEEDNPLYKEAKEETEKANGEKVYWSLEKLVQGRGWGWWSVYKKLDEFETDLEKTIPNPGKTRLIRLEGEYTPLELHDLLQTFGSYLSSLHHVEGMVEAQCHALKESFKAGMAVAMVQLESKATTVSTREAEVLATNELFRHTRRLQIDSEATLMLVKGWRTAYENAFSTISRIVTLRGSEASLQTNRYP